MKKQLLVSLTFFSALFSNAQTEKTGWEHENLKGKVKSITETVFDATEKFGEVEKSAKVKRYVTEFNSAGMEVQWLNERYDEDEKDKFVRTTRYENNKAVELKEDDNGEVQVSKVKYNPQGTIESMDAVDGKGNLMFRQKNKYNAEGLLIQADSYKADGSPELKSVNSYNAKKQLVNEEWYNGEGKLTRMLSYTYDNRGNVVEKTSVDYEPKKKNPVIYQYGYDDKGNKIEERHSIAGLDKKAIFEYNAQGDMVRNVDAYGGEEKKVYTYDAQNNWIKCVTKKAASYGKTGFEIAERQIKYY